MYAEASCGFEPRAADVSGARRFCASTLDRWLLPDIGWVVAQLVSEVATNAVIHARTQFTVSMRLSDDILTLEVTDHSPTKIRVRHNNAESTTGRGIGLVQQLTSSWGVTKTSDGKTVWARLDVREPPALAFTALVLEDPYDVADAGGEIPDGTRLGANSDPGQPPSTLVDA